RARRLDVVRVPAEQTLAEYLTSGWIENIDPATVEDITINGFPGATALAKGDQWDFRLYAIRFGSDVYRFIFAAKHRTPETDRIFRESIGTFRRMTLAEIEQAKPLHLMVVKVAPGDTVEKLASRMAGTDRAVERFRVLNGLNPGDKLKPGSEVKIVVEGRSRRFFWRKFFLLFPVRRLCYSAQQQWGRMALGVGEFSCGS